MGYVRRDSNQYTGAPRITQREADTLRSAARKIEKIALRKNLYVIDVANLGKIVEAINATLQEAERWQPYFWLVFSCACASLQMPSYLRWLNEPPTISRQSNSNINSSSWLNCHPTWPGIVIQRLQERIHYQGNHGSHESTWGIFHCRCSNTTAHGSSFLTWGHWHYVEALTSSNPCAIASAATRFLWEAGPFGVMDVQSSPSHLLLELVSESCDVSLCSAWSKWTVFLTIPGVGFFESCRQFLVLAPGWSWTTLWLRLFFS